MKRYINNYPIPSCIIIFTICGLARLTEYFVIRTDETIIMENFLHKIFGIIVLTVLLRLLHSSPQSIGFTKSGILLDIVKGLLLGCGCFTIAYAIECFILYRINRNVSLAFYISGFSLNGEMLRHTGIPFFILCIACNLINVWMEEGVFRGLFMKILAGKLSFKNAALLIALLFGIWHLVMPLRDYADGNISSAALLVMSIGYIVLAGVMSIKWSLLYKMTRLLWMGIGDHLFNNVIVTNLLHVISNNEADSMQIVRILIGQLLSFSVVLIQYRRLSYKCRMK